MAILTLDSLTGCNSIPSFFGGNSDTPANPTYTVFYQTAAPTSWVKDTTASLNDKALRVIGGANGTALSPGGSLAFTSVFTTKTYPGVALGPAAAAQSLTSTPLTFVTSQNASPDTITFNPHAGTPATMPPHNHPYQTAPGAQNLIAAPGVTGSLANATAPALTTSTFYGPGGTSHTHSFTAQHTHSAAAGGASHGHNTTATHTHAGSTASANFSINYIDVIIAYKA